MAKTPLHREWVLWFDNPRLAEEGQSWRDNLKECGTFSSVETFWEVFNNVQPASALSANSNYHIFVKGVEPMWEDRANVNGGKFVLTIPKKESKGGRLDESWLFLPPIQVTSPRGLLDVPTEDKKSHDREATPPVAPHHWTRGRKRWKRPSPTPCGLCEAAPCPSSRPSPWSFPTCSLSSYCQRWTCMTPSVWRR